MIMTLKQLQNEVFAVLKNKPSCYTKGQYVYNYIDFEYGVAKDVKNQDGIDCREDDTKIDLFVELCAKRIKEETDNE